MDWNGNIIEISWIDGLIRHVDRIAARSRNNQTKGNFMSNEDTSSFHQAKWKRSFFLLLFYSIQGVMIDELDTDNEFDVQFDRGTEIYSLHYEPIVNLLM